jgi:hypothetical protein
VYGRVLYLGACSELCLVLATLKCDLMDDPTTSLTPVGGYRFVSLRIIGQVHCMLMTFHGSMILKDAILLQLAFEPPL